MFKYLTAAAVLMAATSMAAPKSAFKSYTYPHGQIIKYGDDAMIKDHFAKWKKAWMTQKNGQTWILAPEGTCSTVSEAIAYGMMIMVFMDDGTNGAEQDFANLYSTWKSNGGTGGGMNWRVSENGCSQAGGSGSASDADFDAAMALAMAGAQWNNKQYTEDAKTIAAWTASNDIASNKIKPGNQWNDGFNPSYATLANFRIFKAIGASGDWDGIATQAISDLKACQDKSTGLVPDWCDWNSHQPMRTNASVQQDNEPLGLYDDAARTYWRMAWDYYWYGTSDSKSINNTLTKWLYGHTKNSARNIIGGYKIDGTDVSTRVDFASSTFSGGLGLAASSDDSEEGYTYLQTVYTYLASRTSCATAAGCGEGVPGEKYYPGTLNILYLLLLTGHMPNLVDMTGFTEFTPDPSLAPKASTADGVQMAVDDTTVGVSGFWNWGAYHDKYNIGTEMSPDSGSSPLFYKADLDQVVAWASMTLGNEPEWTQAAADAGTLKYPSAGIAMSFLPNSKKSVDLNALGVKSVRVTAKVVGEIRMAVLNDLSEAAIGAGTEPGVYLKESADFTAQTFDLTPTENGFKGFVDGNNFGGLLSWITSDAQKRSDAPMGEDIIKAVRGLKFEVKTTGLFSDITIKSIEFLDASGNVIDPVKITGMAGVGTKPAASEPATPTSSGSQDPTSAGTDPAVPGSSAGTDPAVPGSSAGTDPFNPIVNPGSSGDVALPAFANVAKFKANVAGMVLQISNATAGSNFAVFSMQGKVITSGKVLGSTHSVVLPNKGAYLVRVGSEIRTINVK